LPVIGWSGNDERYTELLQQFEAVHEELQAMKAEKSEMQRQAAAVRRRAVSIISFVP
jgi:hypothetical protein